MFLLTGDKKNSRNCVGKRTLPIDFHSKNGIGHLCSGQQLEGTYLYPPCGMQVVQPLLRTGRDKEEQIPEKLPVLLPPSGTARCILYVIIYIYIYTY